MQTRRKHKRRVGFENIAYLFNLTEYDRAVLGYLCCYRYYVGQKKISRGNGYHKSAMVFDDDVDYIPFNDDQRRDIKSILSNVFNDDIRNVDKRDAIVQQKGLNARIEAKKVLEAYKLEGFKFNPNLLMHFELEGFIRRTLKGWFKCIEDYDLYEDIHIFKTLESYLQILFLTEMTKQHKTYLFKIYDEIKQNCYYC